VCSHERAIYVAALALVNEAEAALEVAQATMVQAFRSLPKLSPPEHLKIWIIRIALSEARRFLCAREHVTCDEVFLDNEIGAHENHPHRPTEWEPISPVGFTQNWTNNHLRSTVERLPRKDRIVLLLRDALHLTTSETAEAIGIGEQTVRARLARARFQVCDDLARSNKFAQLQLDSI
jgi:RNA polymerase sigma factor (sigma-70 family)